MCANWTQSQKVLGCICVISQQLFRWINQAPCEGAFHFQVEGTPRNIISQTSSSIILGQLLNKYIRKVEGTTETLYYGLVLLLP